MVRAALRHIVIGLAATGWLAGCVGGTETGAAGGNSGETTANAPSQPRSGTGREVEAPEAFQTTDSASWDGRPTLGGIWVASPDRVDPERVVMFNAATGKTVTGALFRRERGNPRPTLQVSSDAADVLQMLAGQPTEFRVTALRKAEKKAPPAKQPAAPAVAAAESADGDGSAAETAALATAAIAATAGTEAESGAAAADKSAAAAGALADATDAAPTDAEPRRPKPGRSAAPRRKQSATPRKPKPPRQAQSRATRRYGRRNASVAHSGDDGAATTAETASKPKCAV